MSQLIKKAMGARFSRKSFLGGAAALMAAAVVPTYGLKKIDSQAAAEKLSEEGRWVSASCWHNCGGRCLNKGFVVDGIVTKQKTDNTHEDSPDYPQQRGCARGRSQRHQVFGVDRLKYPMKRKHWEPGGGKKELRGKDEWVRISWDEALDLVSEELKRVKENYGNEAILGSSRLMNHYGGALVRWGSSSSGAWGKPQEHMANFMSWSANDRMDWRNAKLIVMWGSNPAWSSAGNPTYNLLQAKKAGAKFIFVDPYMNPTIKALGADLVPCRPGTDTALLLGMAHHMIENDLHDQEFLDKCTVGFDKDHMPEGADPEENFKDYVLGTYDGTPKTPDWASEICGTDPEKIREFAQQVGTVKPMIFTSSFAPARTFRGQQFCQAFLTVGWMTGNVGKSGAGVWTMSYGRNQSYGGKTLVSPGDRGLPRVENPLFPGVTYGAYDGYRFGNPTSKDFHGMAYTETYDAILNNEYHATVRGKVPCDIRLIWKVRPGSGDNFLNQSSDIQKGIKAFRKVDSVITNDIVLSTISKYADIVLPATTEWEKEGRINTGNPEAIFVAQKVTEPLFEAKTEEWMEMEIAKRIGLDPEELYPVDEKQQFFNSLAGAQVIKDNGEEYEPLVTITKEDINKWGVAGEPQKGKIKLDELLERGAYQVPRAPGDNLTVIQGEAFVNDPEKNPLETKSGKLEIHCQPLADDIQAYGFTSIAPIAKYEPPVEGIEDTYENWNNKVKGEFPFQLYTIHYPRRSHSVFDNVPQLREAFPQEFIMNTRDANERGLHDGDTVLIRSRHGKVVRHLHTTESMMPGVVTLGEGAWVELDEDTGICKAGATNMLHGTHLSGQGEEPWNTCNVTVEKYEGEQLLQDSAWEPRVIF
ncbi:molybdopterin-dependent oxidoreductase [Salipaludibacillus sp. CUR1]|uniref:molybdopterin-dependent oxidoreductase n=1 Tax=Salipaludibacillus sp. CUR1 TaxID=2820003 RepID=UPI001E49709F|nr:molybdopterin-dependent oxidoreductase [Salipaludibacillus sp. CUR1]MCE7791797.1 molybdopterin-dependent oxidoreductase [Salipaludibacillus sp. CUR1]